MFAVISEHISNLVLAFLLLTLNMLMPGGEVFFLKVWKLFLAYSCKICTVKAKVH